MKRVFFVLLMCTIFSNPLFANIYDETNEMCNQSSEKKTAKEMLLDEGWEEYAVVSAYYKSNNWRDGDVMAHYGAFTIFCKRDLIVAVKSSDLKYKSPATKHSVRKGNYRVLGESYNARISFHGNALYFNF